MSKIIYTYDGLRSPYVTELRETLGLTDIEYADMLTARSDSDLISALEAGYVSGSHISREITLWEIPDDATDLYVYEDEMERETPLYCLNGKIRKAKVILPRKEA